MAGIYIHIPFCKQRCTYCDFHFSTNTEDRKRIVHCIVKELISKKHFFGGQPLESIYLGGGTPSLLSDQELNFIFEAIYNHYPTFKIKEITMEGNPDDFTNEYLETIKNSTPINRLSIGIQSFDQSDLLKMNRAHNAIEARNCIENALTHGFNSLSIDLIFGMPWQKNFDYLEKNFKIIADLSIGHISCYQLTVEDKTQLFHQIKKNIFAEHTDQVLIDAYQFCKKRLNAMGFEQYEISNYAQKGNQAVHNTNYWKNKPYIGIGPSAHSFDGQSRFWNIANNPLYCKKIENNEQTWVVEKLTLANKWNELIMTGLRTKWGVSIHNLKTDFPQFYAKSQNTLQQLLKNNLIELKDDSIMLTAKGQNLCNQVSLELIIAE